MLIFERCLYSELYSNIGFELYILHAKVNNIKFLLSYLFLKNNSRCKDGIWINILQNFLQSFEIKDYNLNFF